MEPAEAKALDLIVLRLQRRFPDRTLEDIRAEVDRVHQHYDHSRLRGFIAILVEREVAENFARHHAAS